MASLKLTDDVIVGVYFSTGTDSEVARQFSLVPVTVRRIRKLKKKRYMRVIYAFEVKQSATAV